LFKKNTPFKLNGKLLAITTDIPIVNDNARIRNILPFMKNIYDSSHCIEGNRKIKQNPFTKDQNYCIV